MPRPTRAEPLAPEQRRRAIIEAVIPLLVARGGSVTTREMAAAAGVAEGTIFKVFPDKATLIHEAIKVSVDPARVQGQLGEIYEGAPLEVQVGEATRIIFEHYERTITLFMVLRDLPVEHKTPAQADKSFLADSTRAIHRSLTEIFERNRHLLTVEPDRAAAVLRALVFAGAHPFLGQEGGIEVAEIVSILLHGITAGARDQVVA